MILIALIVVSVLLLLCALNGSYRAGYQEGFAAGAFEVSHELDELSPKEAGPLTHAEIQTELGRRGLQ